MIQDAILHADTVILHADTVILHSDTAILYSNTAILYSDTAIVHSDTAIWIVPRLLYHTHSEHTNVVITASLWPNE